MCADIEGYGCSINYILTHVKYILYIEGITPTPCLGLLTRIPFSCYNRGRSRDSHLEEVVIEERREIGMSETKRREWERDPQIAPHWQEVWEQIRASRIGGCTEEWADTDDAYNLAYEFAERVLGEDVADEGTDEFYDLVDECIEQIRELL